MMAELVIAMVEVRADLCLRVIHSFLHVSVMHKTLLFCQGLFLSQE